MIVRFSSFPGKAITLSLACAGHVALPLGADSWTRPSNGSQSSPRLRRTCFLFVFVSPEADVHFGENRAASKGGSVKSPVCSLLRAHA